MFHPALLTGGASSLYCTGLPLSGAAQEALDKMTTSFPPQRAAPIIQSSSTRFLTLGGRFFARNGSRTMRGYSPLSGVGVAATGALAPQLQTRTQTKAEKLEELKREMFQLLDYAKRSEKMTHLLVMFVKRGGEIIMDEVKERAGGQSSSTAAVTGEVGVVKGKGSKEQKKKKQRTTGPETLPVSSTSSSTDVVLPLATVTTTTKVALAHSGLESGGGVADDDDEEEELDWTIPFDATVSPGDDVDARGSIPTSSSTTTATTSGTTTAAGGAPPPSWIFHVPQNNKSSKKPTGAKNLLHLNARKGSKR